ncbi:MAG TPA: carbohydrate kinase family protein [Gammaproteobacteria bacterium]|nr:carbohydrate kinase family protein [Gammaproteobacteria bacterium]
MAALICGSIAYDNIMVFPDSFKNHILPEQIHILNVAFLVPEMRREFGGCALNIAYNLKLLGDDPLPMGTAGSDFQPYREWLERWGIRQDHIRVLDDVFTAQAFITTDLDDNQITAFHPGAMNFSHLNSVADARDVTIAIVSPDGRDGMIAHAEELAAARIPFVFDPGQGLPMFDGEALRRFVELATWVTVNDYEWQLLKDRTGWDIAQFTERVQGLIVTRGDKGSRIHTLGGDLEIPPAKPRAVVDPTGCGDAYRAGLLYGLVHDLDWKTTGRIASLMGAIKIESHGTQNHRFSMPEFASRYRESFGQPFQE